MIKSLPPHLAALIAAGEVIDAPYSIVRECADNSIDAGASFISVKYTDKTNLQISDNGSGIEESDFVHIARMHSTSKIQTRDDIYNISTLGFRGEALFSIASVSDLTIESNGFSLNIHESVRQPLRRTIVRKGTVIKVADLFMNIPARLNFMHSNSYEKRRCHDTLFEKALFYNDVSFSFSDEDGKSEEWESEAREKRVGRFFTGRDIVHFEADEKDFYLECWYLRDSFSGSRKKIKVFANGHIVDYYALQSALLHGMDSLLPGGSYPEALVFLTVKPELVDFNINPTKRECKLRNESEVFRSLLAGAKESLKPVISTVDPTFVVPDRNFKNCTEEFDTVNAVDELLKGSYSALEYDSRPRVKAYDFGNQQKSAFEFGSFNERRQDVLFDEIKKDGRYKYIGQCFNLFLIAEREDMLYFVDMHAAAERVLFEKIKCSPDMQPLLIPMCFEARESFAESAVEVFRKFSIVYEKTEQKDIYLLKAVPSIYNGKESEIIKMIQAGDYDEGYISARLYSVFACRRSIKQGEVIPDEIGQALIDEVLKLDNPVCPHGRMFVSSISRESLFHSVMR